MGDAVLSPSDNQNDSHTEGTRKLGDLETTHFGDLNPDADNIRGLNDEDLMDAIENPKNGQKIKVRKGENRVLNGNTRTEEAKKRFPADTEIPVDELPPREDLDP